MTAKSKRHSMAESLKRREDVKAFLEAGTTNRQKSDLKPEQKESPKTPEPRIAVTLRLPEKIAHALIDASAERRKNRKKAWSQQDIVAEALEEWFGRSMEYILTGNLTQSIKQIAN